MTMLVSPAVFHGRLITEIACGAWQIFLRMVILPPTDRRVEGLIALIVAGRPLPPIHMVFGLNLLTR